MFGFTVNKHRPLSGQPVSIPLTILLWKAISEFFSRLRLRSQQGWEAKMRPGRKEECKKMKGRRWRRLFGWPRCYCSPKRRRNARLHEAGSHWDFRLQQRNGLSIRSPSITAPLPNLVPLTPQQIQTALLSRSLSMDETGWKCLASLALTWSEEEEMRALMSTLCYSDGQILLKSPVSGWD